MIQNVQGWPFVIDDPRKQEVMPELYYAFCDSGGYDSKHGYLTAEACKEAMREYDPESYREQDFSTDPERLGEVMYCVITGQQYIRQILKLQAPLTDLSDYGHWTTYQELK